jgi:UDP-N-acetylglucosamine diphosphorylase / glucose-1-phosphate thymidylyltransferase / UDP-N-acetylgalactosamine diphosphorylase / glucosamine-1-phosphate N-acetyltransferase / galactosamine-1-phosphate N-acetyltransferase
MIAIRDFITEFPLAQYNKATPWEVTTSLAKILENLLLHFGDEFKISAGIAIHHSAIIESGTVLKRPIIICADCFIGANSYLRGGVYLDSSVSVGPNCEIKSSIISKGSSIAHFNFIGDSIIGSNVNFEAGSLTANHHNDKANKEILIYHNDKAFPTGITKFGALVGDNCKIGANAVLSPGTILSMNSIVNRLQLVDQSKLH